MVAGQNTIGFCCRSIDGPSAVFLRLDLEFEDRRQRTILTDERWQSIPIQGDDLDWPQIEGLKPKPVAMFGCVARFPWGETSDSVTVRPLDDYTQWKQAQGTKTGTAPATFRVVPGFEIELLHSADRGEDSWVSMTFDPQGRLIVAMEKQGLLRLMLTKSADEEIRVETIDERLRECRGLLFARGSLYAMANNDKGLYRLLDTNGDDRFDQVRLLKTFDGDVGHGRNQLVLGPDGLVYAIFGDSVYEPQAAKKRPPALLNPTRAEKTRSGFFARTDFDGRDWEILVRGLRNPFGIAFNPDGEPFTYDADAEYDMGASWYRPTQVNHLISGADFGWRRVTKQWPPYVPDRPDIPQTTLDIGKGSPTAVVFRHRMKMPCSSSTGLTAAFWPCISRRAVRVTLPKLNHSFVAGRPTSPTSNLDRTARCTSSPVAAGRSRLCIASATKGQKFTRTLRRSNSGNATGTRHVRGNCVEVSKHCTDDMAQGRSPKHGRT